MSYQFYHINLSVQPKHNPILEKQHIATLASYYRTKWGRSRPKGCRPQTILSIVCIKASNFLKQINELVFLSQILLSLILIKLLTR